jgi:hypothetical protein
VPIPEDQLARWRFEFKLHGMIRLPGLLPVDLVDDMNRQFADFLSIEIEMDRKGQRLSGRGNDRYAVSIGAMVARMGGPLDDPRARRNPLVEELVTALMGPWRYSRLIVECPCPGAGYMGWHIDAEVTPLHRQTWPKPTRQLKLHVPLVDVGEDNAPMEVIPGSHRMYFTEGDEDVLALPEAHSHRVLLRRGDALLRDGELVHRGTPNRSAAPRPLYSQIYKSLGE